VILTFAGFINGFQWFYPMLVSLAVVGDFILPMQISLAVVGDLTYACVISGC
jgi:hypothetical protein